MVEGNRTSALSHPLVVEYLEAVEKEATHLGPLERAGLVMAESRRVESHFSEHVDSVPDDDFEDAVRAALDELRASHHTRGSGSSSPPASSSGFSSEFRLPMVDPRRLTITASVGIVVLPLSPIVAVVVGAIVAGAAWYQGRVNGTSGRSVYRTPLLLGLVPFVILLVLMAFAVGGSLTDPYSPLR